LSETASPSCLCGAWHAQQIQAGVDRRNGPPYPYALLRCAACDLVRVDPRPNEDTYGHGDAATAQRIANEPQYAGFAAAVLADVRRAVGPPAGRFLDVGCNIGTLVAAAQAAGFDAWGIDLDPLAIAHGQARGRQLRLGLLGEADLPAAFDVIVANHVLEHVTDVPAFLAAAASRLAPAGRLFINVPNLDGLVPALMKANWGALWPHQHVWQFTPATLQATVERAAPLRAEAIRTDTNLEPPSAGAKGLAKAVVVALSTVVGRGDEIKAVFRHA
jgi:SAM-dependent methyltransferase